MTKQRKSFFGMIKQRKSFFGMAKEGTKILRKSDFAIFSSYCTVKKQTVNKKRKKAFFN